jgi:hypothetical protein
MAGIKFLVIFQKMGEIARGKPCQESLKYIPHADSVRFINAAEMQVDPSTGAAHAKRIFRYLPKYIPILTGK